ncbi:16S rRNA (guanine(966)-N(2))-methyltransferase RsmD [Zhihengliuella flava]|uniref:16S rRNA (Guanine966-N2)-methyltransferase n=1 Tax=Zhihengliuella flava TaxID=1285193 RepID=A0A931D9X9_9MICC|nr:16S rRNA (guanine(966)-N(2))-methyltransferase RsmD [Zhihengliuella flava]MBG6083531.1 16S rRNA (guanine966-N2)-methyltransferase [Zhihengliuella flava]
MSRIIAGAAGGLSLTSVPGTGTRPTTDRVKESLFSRLEHWDAISGARVLDLFAGSGALGLEALSRGAERALLIDSAEPAVRAARKNADIVNRALRTRSGDAPGPRVEDGTRGARVLRGKAPAVLDGVRDVWDLVFLDPPYPLGEEELAAILAAVAPRLADDAVVVIERSSRSPEPTWPEALVPLSGKKFGETRLWYAEPAAGADHERNDP